MPIFDAQGHRRGIYIINYRAANIFDRAPARRPAPGPAPAHPQPAGLLVGRRRVQSGMGLRGPRARRRQPCQDRSGHVDQDPVRNFRPGPLSRRLFHVGPHRTEDLRPRQARSRSSATTTTSSWPRSSRSRNVGRTHSPAVAADLRLIVGALLVCAHHLRRPLFRRCAARPNSSATASSISAATCFASPVLTATSSAPIARGKTRSATRPRNSPASLFITFVHPDDREKTAAEAAGLARAANWSTSRTATGARTAPTAGCSGAPAPCPVTMSSTPPPATRPSAGRSRKSSARARSASASWSRA